MYASSTLTKSFYITAKHRSIAAWGYSICFCAISKESYIVTGLSNILFTSETTNLSGYTPGDFWVVIFKYHSAASPRLKTVFIFNQSLCYNSNDETACVLHSECWLICQENRMITTLALQGSNWKCDSCVPDELRKCQQKCDSSNSLLLPQLTKHPRAMTSRRMFWLYWKTINGTCEEINYPVQSRSLDE